MSNNAFSHNGASSLSLGGAFKAQNSDVTVFNNTFTSNQANRGGSIALE